IDSYNFCLGCPLMSNTASVTAEARWHGEWIFSASQTAPERHRNGTKQPLPGELVHERGYVRTEERNGRDQRDKPGHTETEHPCHRSGYHIELSCVQIH